MPRRTGSRKGKKKIGSASEQRAAKHSSANSSARASRNTEQARRKRAVRRKRQLFWFRLVCGLLICAVVVLAPTVFFRVSTVNVAGDTRYDAEELITASGIREGDNMFFLDKDRVSETLQEMYPYLDTVKIKRKLPSTLNIEVTEREASLSVERGGKYILMDMTGKALEQVAAVAVDTVEVIGAQVDDLIVGETIAEEDEKIIAVIDLMELMEQYGLDSEVNAVNIDKAYEVKMLYADSYKILLGDLSNLEHKIQFLQAILKESSLPATGIIDLTDDEKAHYRPGDISITDDEEAAEDTPDETTPDETSPDEDTPDETTPDETSPEEDTPEDATPDETAPDDTGDDVTEEPDTENEAVTAYAPASLRTGVQMLWMPMCRKVF